MNLSQNQYQNFKRYLTKSEIKPENIKVLSLYQNVKLTQKDRSPSKHSTGIENKPVNYMKKFPLKKSSSEKRKGKKLEHYQNVNDFGEIL